MKNPPEENRKSSRFLLLAVTLGASLPLSVMAQDQGGGPQGGPPMGPPPGQRPPPPVIAALDTNKDGVISASEIANASDALKSLDKNGDGQLTQDELRPPPRNGQGQGQGRQNSQNQGNGQPQN